MIILARMKHFGVHTRIELDKYKGGNLNDNKTMDCNHRRISAVIRLNRH